MNPRTLPLSLAQFLKCDTSFKYLLSHKCLQFLSEPRHCPRGGLVPLTSRLPQSLGFADSILSVALGCASCMLAAASWAGSHAGSDPFWGCYLVSARQRAVHNSRSYLFLSWEKPQIFNACISSFIWNRKGWYSNSVISFAYFVNWLFKNLRKKSSYGPTCLRFLACLFFAGAGGLFVPVWEYVDEFSRFSFMWKYLYLTLNFESVLLLMEF